MFKGATLLNIDGKNRLAIPTKYREELLIGSLVLTAHPHGCLLLYPVTAWNPIQRKVMQFSSFDKKSSGLQRLLVGYAEDICSDNSGRLLISAALRDYAGIKKTLIFVGQGSHFELWSIEAWNKQIKQIKINDKEELPDELGGFSL
ncbi:division/cell wall cluster transcriptional repressor MraZ [Nitrosomonadales bacterium]|nr:division/cell wall cluster transcriptional repressor MraZ [Nitrosomonadales bacterium]